MTAFDNRGAGRTAMPDGSPTVEAMADDAAAVLRGLNVPSACAGFSGGSIIAQELALRHPELVRSLVLQSTWPAMDQYMKTLTRAIHWQAELAPDERAFLEFFFLLVYTPRAHNSGMVSQIIDDVLAFPYQQSTGDFLKFLDAFVVHETGSRLGQINAPTLVLAGGVDPMSRPELGEDVARRIPGAQFEVMPEELPTSPSRRFRTEWNARVHEFWQQIRVGAQGSPYTRRALSRAVSCTILRASASEQSSSSIHPPTTLVMALRHSLAPR